jgi:ubiquinol-cytochrome c reductase cytochrome c subunit
MNGRYLIGLTLLMLPGLAVSQETAATDSAASGKRLFVRDGCYQCHGYAGQGGAAGARIAPPPFNAQGLIRYVRKPAGAMPAFTEKVASDQELTDIWAYLKSLPAPKAVKDIPLLNAIRPQ